MLLASAAGKNPITETAGVAAVPPTRAGCGFAVRCPHKLGSICDTISAPPIKPLSTSHAIACHLAPTPDVGLPHVLVRPVVQGTSDAR